MLNIFIIFSPLIFLPYILRTRNKPLLFRTLLFLVFSFSLTVTMCFPVIINGLTYDYRSIMVVAGSLYGGVYVAFALYGVLLIVRTLLGFSNLLEYFVAILPALALVLWHVRGFAGLTLTRKIWTGIFLASSMKLIVFIIYLSFIGQLELLLRQPIIVFGTYLVGAVLIAVFIAMMEHLHRYQHMQEEVWKSEKIKIVSDMAASVAHEIRNPLTTVRGFIQLFGVDHLDKERRTYYQQICLEELDRAQVIISDYLSLAKPDPETVERINVNEEIVYLSSVLLTFANYNNIQINGIEASDRELAIVGDRHKFRQALVNLGKNAIEAMVHGGTLELKATAAKEDVKLLISDNGVGMTPAQVRRLGTPYYSTKEKGTGLGTMVSFGILKKMNGRIEIESELGKGTEYTITFPKA